MRMYPPGYYGMLIRQRRVRVMLDAGPQVFTVTLPWIEEHRGWTADMLAALGIAWPPTAGWKQRAVGQRITEAQRILFEVGSFESNIIDPDDPTRLLPSLPIMEMESLVWCACYYS